MQAINLRRFVELRNMCRDLDPTASNRDRAVAAKLAKLCDQAISFNAEFQDVYRELLALRNDGRRPT